jgi:hypothetical protein
MLLQLNVIEWLKMIRTIILPFWGPDVKWVPLGKNQGVCRAVCLLGALVPIPSSFYRPPVLFASWPCSPGPTWVIRTITPS